MSNPQWKTITESLRSRIQSGELAPGHRIPVEQDVADAWGVSRHTAHRAIRELQGEGLVARQRRWGTVVVSKPRVQTGRIAFIFDRAAETYDFPSWQMLNGLQKGLGESCDVICRACKQDSRQDESLLHLEEARLLQKLSADTDGIVIYPTAHPQNTPLLQRVADTKALVVLDRIPEGLNAHSVVSDNYDATLQAMQKLISRGHKRIGFFSFQKLNFSTIRERFSAYEFAMNEIGADNSRYVRWFPRELDGTPEACLQAVHDSLFTLMHQKDPITALFCVQDSFASVALQACDHMQARVPEDLELATFNDWPPAMLRRPWQIHRIVQSSHDIGLEAGRILSRAIAVGKEPPMVHRVRAEFHAAGTGLPSDPSTGSLLSAPVPFLTNGG